MPAASAPKALVLRRLAELPSPRRMPLLGNLLELAPERLHLTLERWARRHGPLCVYHLGRQPILLVSDAALARALNKARTGPARRMSALSQVFEEIIGAGLFTAEGDEWRRQRQLWMQSLSARHLRRFLPTIEAIVERLRRHWLASAGRPIDVRRDLVAFALDVTATLAFGFPVNTLEGVDAALGKDLSRIFPALVRRLVSPIPYWRWLPTPADRALERGMQQLFVRLRATIADARTRADGGGSTEGAETFLEALLRARDEQGQPHSEAQIIANSLTMLLGGQDTTANSLAWAIHYLADSPERLEQLRAEAAAAGPASFGSDDVQFPQTSAVASEVLRARPPVTFFSLEAREDLVVEDVFVPRGTPIQIVTRPSLERLPDGGCPLAFDPDRWLDSARAPGARQSDLAFGSGPRACPGRTLALLEMRLVLGMLSQNFTLERVGARDAVRELNQLTMIPDGLRVRLTPRGHAAR